MTGCDCLRTIDDALIARGLLTRVAPVLFLSGRVARAGVRTYVPESLQPRAASGRLIRRVKPLTLAASYCPWCGAKYPDDAALAEAADAAAPS